MKSLIACAFLFACLGVAQTTEAQKSQSKDAPIGRLPAPGTIEGSVTNSLSHAPVPGAGVMFSGGQGYSYVGVTDTSGKFLIRNVDPGIYSLGKVQAPGFVNRPATDLGSLRVDVAEAQNVTGLKIELEPLGVISGKVVDDDGEPLSNAYVEALVADYSRGRKELSTTRGSFSDDKGQYRLFGLPAGRYLVRAWIQPLKIREQEGIQLLEANTHWLVPATGYRPSYYPAAEDPAQAVLLPVTPGGETAGVDFRLRVVPVYQLRGKVNGLKQGQFGYVMARPCGVSDLYYFMEQVYFMEQEKKTEFDIPGLPAGSWCVSASTGSGDAWKVARETVTITDHSVEGVLLTPMALKPLQGTVVVDGPPGQQPNPILSVSLLGTEMSNYSARTKDGQFTVANVAPGTFEVQAMLQSPGYYVKSLQYGTQDASEGLVTVRGDPATLKVTLRADGGQLNGVVQTDSGDAGVNTRVVVLPAERYVHRRDLIKIADTDRTGHFKVMDLAPGDYRVLAWTDSELSLWYVPEFQKELSSRATTVTMQPGSSSTIQVKVVSSDDLAKAKAKFL